MKQPAVIDMNDPGSLDDQAAKWVAQLDGEAPSKATLKAFRQWTRQSPAHRKAFEGYVAVWEQMNLLTQLVPPREVQAGEDSPRFSWVWAAPRLAGCAMLLVLVVMLQQWIVPTTQRYTTAVGEQQTITLPDGSIALLNTDSDIEVRYRDDRRVIYLARGEAHFEVMKNPDSPFEVHAGQGLVRAVGTAFGVYLRTDDVEVVVTEGIVELDTLAAANISRHDKEALPPAKTSFAVDSGPPSTDTELAQIYAGNLATYDRHTAKHILLAELEKIEEKVSWHQGLLVFDDEPLQNVVAEVGRYTTTKIVIPEHAVRELKVGGQFKVGDTEAIFEALKISFNIRAETVSEGVIYLVKNDTK